MPREGYPESRDFDQKKELLDALQKAWNDPDDPGDPLGTAIDAMRALRAPARRLVQMPRPTGDDTTFGPDFKV